MRPEQLSSFINPDTGEPLALADAALESGHVRDGKLIGASGSSFPITNFLPRFVPPSNYAENFGLQWQAHRRTQLDSFNGATYSRTRLFNTTRWPKEMPGQRILEAGSGAGRFTEILVGTGADVTSFDFSRAADANYLSNGAAPNLTLFQGDIYRIPFPKRSFDRVICIGVLQHTPDVRASFMSLASMVRPGGSLVVDAYPRIWTAMLHWKFLLRPLSTRMNPQTLYRAVRWYAPKLMPVARALRRAGGKAAVRLLPILDQSDKSVAPEVQRDWTILDTYDALSAAYDQHQSAETVRRWYQEAGFQQIEVTLHDPLCPGVVGRGVVP